MTSKGDVKEGWKVLTHDFRSPIQGGGTPLWDGRNLPVALPPVDVDLGNAECGAGWNYCGTLSEALYIGGLWPTGFPSVGVQVRAGDSAIQRGNKRRSSTLTLLRVATEQEIEEAIGTKSREYFGAHAEFMATEQCAWRHALARPHCDKEQVESALRVALSVRGLSSWTLQEFTTLAAAWAVRAAWAARDALTVSYAARQGWVQADPELLITGIRDAYMHGLSQAFPVGHKELGWVMAKEKERP